METQPNQLNCDPNLLSEFLNNDLSEDEQTAVERHLDHCQSCRAELNSQAAEPSWWDEARQFLESAADDRLLEDTSAALGSERGLPRIALGFLAPTDDPRMLGRLGAYEIAGVIGCGGMGIVLKGFDRSLNRFVAIKVISPHLATSAAARKRFAREAQAAAAVVHDNVIAIHNVDEAEGLPYLVMSYERGASLHRRLAERGTLGTTEVLRIAMQTALGLGAAHSQGLVHRDIKPANILLDDGTERVKITDFGLARAADDASLTRSGVIAGTPQFMSPEQARGESIDHRSDLFSLGSVMYAMCTGRPPFRAETSYGVLRCIGESQPRPILEVNPQIAPWLCRIIEKLHAKNPNDRYQSAAEVAELLGSCLAHAQQPTSEPLPKCLQKPKGGSGRRWALGITGVGIGLAAITLTILLIHGHRPDPSPPQLPAATDRTAGQAESGELRWDDQVSIRLLEIDRDLDDLELRSERLYDEEIDWTTNERPSGDSYINNR